MGVTGSVARRVSCDYGATPNTWQGWALTVVGCLALFGVVLFGPAIRDNTLRVLWMVLGSAAVVVPSTLLAWRTNRRRLALAQRE